MIKKSNLPDMMERSSTSLRKIQVSFPSVLEKQLSQEKSPPTFHYTGWLIGIFMMVYELIPT